MGRFKQFTKIEIPITSYSPQFIFPKPISFGYKLSLGKVFNRVPLPSIKLVCTTRKAECPKTQTQHIFFL